jgi:hypothetical protein
MLIEIIRKSLRPSSKVFVDVLIEDFLQRKAISNLLIPGCFIDQRDDPDPGESSDKNLGARSNMRLLLLKGIDFTGFQDRIACFKLET